MRLALGPRGGAPNAAFLESAVAAGRRCGVTRLADITGLDRLGMPVWQAVRPAGRSLSVHQGKGASDAAARVGALCEAVEAHCAEAVAPDGPLRRFAELPPRERAPAPDDYARDRDRPPETNEPISWCRATDLAGGGPLWLPHDLISLDYTRGLPTRFERASSGLGAGPTETDALLTSLFEAIERDAVGEWRRLDRPERLATSIAPETIPFDWFQAWRDRLASLDIELRVFRAAAVVDVPVFVCVIGGDEAFGPAYRRFFGSSARCDPEWALFKALAEAIQSRLTLIAGIRDDIMPSSYGRSLARPTRASNAARAWQPAESRACSPESLAAELNARGYPQIAVRRLDDGLDGMAVTKAFVPGLGSFTRTRRREG